MDAISPDDWRKILFFLGTSLFAVSIWWASKSRLS